MQVSSIVLIAAIALGVFAAVFGAVIFALRGMRARGERAARERFPEAIAIVPGANFFGQESQGAGQVRGNGTLVLTPSHLLFAMWVPRREVSIPLKAIQSVETASAHLGKSVGRPLLKVVFRYETGQTDSMAWWVPDADGLKGMLEGARR